PRWDIPSKVDGSAVFGIDVKVPGMLLAAVRCAPRFGARLSRYDAAAVRSKPGVIAVVEVPNGLAVVARTYWQAHQALESADLTWSDEGSRLGRPRALPAIYRERLASGPFHVYKNTGDSSAALQASAVRRTAVYEIPFQAHATMEPMNCTAQIAHGRCDIWVPTQGVEITQNVAMQVTGLPGERITVHRTLIGGGFGRRLLADFVKQALLIAMAVKAPVKLIWSREEDMTHDAYRPAMLHEITGAVSSSGVLTALTHRVVSPSYMLYIFPRGAFPQARDWTQPLLPPPQYDPMSVEGVIDIPYDVAHQRVEQHRLELDVPVSVWRTTGHGTNNFVLESFIDELALAAQLDPLQLRRTALAKNARALKLLEVLAEKADWSRPLPRGSGRGMALARAFGGITAHAAEVSVAGGEVRIRRIVAVLDCGRILDPGIATSNVLGGIVWGLSGMKTAITFDSGRAVQSNFDGFEPLHLWETPPCEVHFVESGAALGGTGELGPVPVQAAVANAIFNASGRRIRTLPLGESALRLASGRAGGTRNDAAQRQRRARAQRGRSGHPAPLDSARATRPHRYEVRLREGALRRVYRAHRRQRRALVLLSGRRRPRTAGHDHRGALARALASRAGMDSRAGTAVRLLPERNDHGRFGAPRRQPRADRRRHRRSRHQHLPLRHIRADPQGGAHRCGSRHPSRVVRS